MLFVDGETACSLCTQHDTDACIALMRAAGSRRRLAEGNRGRQECLPQVTAACAGFERLHALGVPCLQWYNLPTNGASTMFKSVSGELSNLRWDLPVGDMHELWQLPASFVLLPDSALAMPQRLPRCQTTTAWSPTRTIPAPGTCSPTSRGAWQAAGPCLGELLQLARPANAVECLGTVAKGAECGALHCRSKYLFDVLNLPAVINEMALQTLLGNMGERNVPDKY